MIRPLLIGVCVALSACTTFQPVERLDREAVVDEVDVGDEVVVTTASGKAYRFTVSKKSADALIGRRAGRVYTIEYANIRRLDVRQTDAGETLTAGGSTVMATIATLAIAAAIYLGVVIVDATD